jgi:hypothetical protein
MKKRAQFLFLFTLIWLSPLLATAADTVHVRGFTTKNGTYVAPHVRTSPDSSKLNNYSTKGNVNPYTGQTGTRSPYPSTPSISTPSTPYSRPLPTPSLSGDTRVGGYVNKNGTYVAPHYQSPPDASKLNNYSTKGNVNPYTGKQGTRDPYKR